jgi:hypothetical protein
MKQTKNKEYSFEKYVRLPLIPNEPTQQILQCNNEVVRHKRVDNEKIYNRIFDNSIKQNNEDSAVCLNSCNRLFGNFQSPKIGSISEIGELSRYITPAQMDKFQFKYNTNIEVRPTSHPIDPRILQKNWNANLILKDRTDTRTASLSSIPITDACKITNEDRLFGNVNTISVPATSTNNEICMTETRYTDIDNDKLYAYHGTNVLCDDDKRYAQARQKAQNDMITLPLSHNQQGLGIDNIGNRCRQPLPDDASMLSRIFQIVPNETVIESMKTIPNLRVFPLSKQVEIKDSRERKTSHTSTTLDKYNFQSKFRDTKQTTSSEFPTSAVSRLRRSKNNINQKDTSEIVLSDIGDKIPRKPLPDGYQIGVNTTLVV